MRKTNLIKKMLALLRMQAMINHSAGINGNSYGFLY